MLNENDYICYSIGNRVVDKIAYVYMGVLFQLSSE